MACCRTAYLTPLGVVKISGAAARAGEADVVTVVPATKAAVVAETVRVKKVLLDDEASVPFIEKAEEASVPFVEKADTVLPIEANTSTREAVTKIRILPLITDNKMNGGMSLVFSSLNNG